jgi:hypothetical protein
LMLGNQASDSFASVSIDAIAFASLRRKHNFLSVATWWSNVHNLLLGSV